MPAIYDRDSVRQRIVLKNKKKIIEWLNGCNISNYTVNKDLTIDIEGDLDISCFGFPFIPVNFGSVAGDFNCEGNQLTSLEGCPSKVAGSYVCSYNNLKSLSPRLPTHLKGNLHINDNLLEDLEGLPLRIDGNLWISSNKLKSLENCLSTIKGNLYCFDNEDIDKNTLPPLSKVIGEIITRL